MILRELRSRMRGQLASVADVDDGALDKFIGEAIMFYSAEYPRRLRHTLTLTTGTQAYNLPGAHNLHGVIGVEYPAGESPPVFLYPAAERSVAFAGGGPYYALRGAPDNADPGSDSVAGSIVFAETVATGETAVIEYYGAHRLPDVGDDDAIITVPAQHMEAIIAFVDFRAHWLLEYQEAITLTTVSVVLSQLGEEGRRAWNRYKEVMDRMSWLGGPTTQVDNPVWSSVTGGYVY